MGDDGTTPLPLTSHTLAPVPVAIGGRGLPASIVFRDDLPDAGLANITGVLLQCANPAAAPSRSLPTCMPDAARCKLDRAIASTVPCCLPKGTMKHQTPRSGAFSNLLASLCMIAITRFVSALP